MNPQLHDEFVTLVALFYAGELSDEEWALLQVHLAYCDVCRSTFEQYKHITSDVIPAMAARASAEFDTAPMESDRAIAEAERRLMSHLGAVPHTQEQPAIRKPSWRMLTGALAACAMVVAAFGYIHLTRNKPQPQALSGPNVPAVVPSTSKTETALAEDLRRELGHTQQEVAQLQQQLATANDRSAQSDSAESVLRRQLQTEQEQREQLATQREALNQQLTAARADAQSMRDKMASAEEDANQQAAHTASLEAKVRELNVALDETNTALDDKDRILSLDKDFLAHDRDIRDLIGARNLYIADIFDTNENGKTAKPFGRIFYTKDRSLVFYGFDLEKQSGLKQSVAFQAWGSGSDKQPTSLGLFYQDDSHKRWVLRCSDAKTLARMNMVFVTVEPPGGSAKPTGKQLLRAYLQIQPNHP